MEAREIRGMWWLAGMPKKGATPGTLVISADRSIRLNLDTDMMTNIDWTRFWVDPTATLPFLRVFGELVSRRPTPVTLDRCFFTRDQFELVAHTALIGRQYRSNQPIALRDVRLSFSHLDAWSAAHDGNGFDLRWHVDGDWEDADESEMYFAAQWRKPRPCTATLPDGTRIEVVMELHEGTRGPAVLTASLKQYTQLQILFPERRALDEVQRVVYNLRNFLALGAGTGIRVDSMFGHVDPIPRIPSDPFFQTTEIIYGLIEPAEVDDDPNPLRMLFVLSDVASRFNEHINGWFEARERLDTVMDLYFSTLHARPRYPETQFLMYMQALEGYHRRTFEGAAAWPPSEWAKVKAQLLNGVDDKYKRKFRGRRLEILNSRPLSGRLSDLMKLCPKASQRILRAGGTSKGEFLEAAQATRNDQAHMFVERPDKAAHGIPLIRLTAQVAALLEALLLRDAGIDDADIGERLWRGRRLDRMRIG